MQSARYDHVQKGRLHPLLHAVAGGTLLGGLAFPDEPYVMVALCVAAAGLFAGALGSHHLRVRDEGDALAVRFGPLPFLRKRIPWKSVREASRGRTMLLDGVGVHWLPFRGWSWRVGGRDCVRLRTDRQTLRIGTDDPEGLLALVRARTAAAAREPDAAAPVATPEASPS